MKQFVPEEHVNPGGHSGRSVRAIGKPSTNSGSRPFELSFDLVVVFAITQVTSFLSHNLRGVVSSVGRIMNPRPARSQLIGGITMGLSTALHENSVIDPQLGPS